MLRGKKRVFFCYLCIDLCVCVCVSGIIFLKGDAVKHGNKGHSEKNKNRIKVLI